MAVRITVQADGRDECAVGFEVLLRALAGVAVEATPTLAPTYMTVANACMARLCFTVPDLQRGQRQSGLTCTQPQDAS